MLSTSKLFWIDLLVFILKIVLYCEFITICLFFCSRLLCFPMAMVQEKTPISQYTLKFFQENMMLYSDGHSRIQCLSLFSISHLAQRKLAILLKASFQTQHGRTSKGPVGNLILWDLVFQNLSLMKCWRKGISWRMTQCSYELR